MAGSEIIVCGQRFDIDHKVVTFEDAKGYSHYLPHCYRKPDRVYPSHPAPGLSDRMWRYSARSFMGRKWRERLSPQRALRKLKRGCRQFLIHMDGCRDAYMCYLVLHDQRGLSVHFMVDNDGTIYQALDLADRAFHGGGVNNFSIGVELQNRGRAKKGKEDYYSKLKLPHRDIVSCKVHGFLFRAFDFSEGQYRAMIKLSTALNKILDLPLVSPQESAGTPARGLIDDYRKFRGFLGHYHIERQKWDPGPWDFQRMFRAIGARVTFPFSRLPKKKELRRLKAKEEERKVKKEADKYYKLSEGTIGAYFPVGPLGRSRLWHGGVHLAAAERAPVYAPIMGQMVAARMAPPCTVGRCNFILLKHYLASHLGERPFYTLFFHLQREEDNEWTKRIVPWLIRTRKEAWRKDLALGRTALMNEKVDAGELLAHVGSAGPPGHRSSQVHFAIFAPKDITRGLLPKERFWDIIRTDGRSRLCEEDKILDRVDSARKGQKGDGYLTRKELREYFRYHPERDLMRKVAVKHLSEWTPRGWPKALEEAQDFSRLPEPKKKKLYKQQIEPTLWWTPEVAAHAGLPRDGVVYSYHPIGFVVWFKQVLRESSSLRSVGIGNKDRYDKATSAEKASDWFKLDSESASGTTDEADHVSGDAKQKLTLEDLVNGYPDDK